VSLNDLLGEIRPGHSLPRDAYTAESIYQADLEHVWYREWILAGVTAAIPNAGDYERVRIGAYDLLLLRGDDGAVRALHNVCRHRGFTLCEDRAGSVRRRIVCPYHQWSYALDGSVAKARAMPEDFDVSGYSLGTAHCQIVSGLIFVCVAEVPPPFQTFADLVAPYLDPFCLNRAVVAHSTENIEHGNWKLVMENNRECFHCRVSHPELMQSFPEEPLHAGNADPKATAVLAELVEACEAVGLPSQFRAAADASYRIMRMPFLEGVSSMTLSGAPAVSQRFAGLPDRVLGDVLLYHYPSSWNHFQADHSVVFRITPTSPTTTELKTWWLVPEGSVAGTHYDHTTLTEVWEATNRQDAALVERAQRGVSSPAYRPGPYSPAEEEGVIQFIDWYVSRLTASMEQGSA
jgi:phenylpropionate dioxygenase-like ring-hydroxylating dioxygenase large terminal subunit